MPCCILSAADGLPVEASPFSFKAGISFSVTCYIIFRFRKMIQLLISNSLDTFKAELSDGRNWYIHGNGLEITLRKDIYSKFVVTGYTNDIFIDKQNTEATETINAVIANYGYTQEFLDLYTLVGAELASVYPNI